MVGRAHLFTEDALVALGGPAVLVARLGAGL